jgi:hypothetical protein
MHFLIQVKVPFGGTTRIEPPQGMLRNQNWSNNILGPFLLNLFIVMNYFFLMFIHCIPNYVALSFYWNKNKWEII